MGANGQFAGNANQKAIIYAVLEAADAGAFITIAKLREQFPDKSKQAILSTIRTLERWDFLTKKRIPGPYSWELLPTPAAYARFRR
jgi:hypothetical protein